MIAIEALQFWRNEDQEDSIVLNRGEVCALLDEVGKLRAALSAPTRWDLAKLDLGPVVIFIAGFLCGVFVPFWH
jgi:hypothetical protein